MENVVQNLDVAQDANGDDRVFSERRLASLAKNAVKGSRCPHGRKWAVTEWSIRINGNVVLHVYVECPHDLDKQKAEFNVVL
jgi:hypothetical protein